MAYKIVFAFLKLLSRLPFWVLHVKSYFIYLLLYYVIGYRKKVILNNLAIAFPNQTSKENKKTARKFVHHFADFLIESLKTLSISEEELQKRYVYKNQHLVQDQIDAGKSIMVVAGHVANWEWLFYYGRVSGILSWTAYSPLKNPIFDKMMVANRERYGFKVFPSKKAANKFAQFAAEGKQFVNFLAADQSPTVNYKYRAKFLGQDVPFFIGAETYAKKYDLPVFYANVQKTGRSKYEVKFIPITLNPQETEQSWITSEYIRLMEENIYQAPENYLWSHRRFKHAQTSKV